MSESAIAPSSPEEPLLVVGVNVTEDELEEGILLELIKITIFNCNIITNLQNNLL